MSSTTRNTKLTSPVAESNAERLFRRSEAAHYLGVSLRWLEGRSDIPAVNLARAASRRAMIRYRRSDLDQFIARHANPDDEGGR